MFIDALGRRAEVIQLDRCDGHGPQPTIRVSWRGILLGAGYYRDPADALALMDAATTVEVVTLPEPADRL